MSEKQRTGAGAEPKVWLGKGNGSNCGSERRKVDLSARVR